MTTQSADGQVHAACRETIEHFKNLLESREVECAAALDAATRRAEAAEAEKRALDEAVVEAARTVVRHSGSARASINAVITELDKLTALSDALAARDAALTEGEGR